MSVIAFTATAGPDGTPQPLIYDPNYAEWEAGDPSYSMVVLHGHLKLHSNAVNKVFSAGIVYEPHDAPPGGYSTIYFDTRTFGTAYEIFYVGPLKQGSKLRIVFGSGQNPGINADFEIRASLVTF